MHFKQGENEEVAAFASRLDNHVRMAKLRGTELLPDEDAVERQLRMLFWEGIKDSIKDKSRHRKDSCKSFSALITAARYGEKEACSAQSPKRVARSNQVTQDPDSKPLWIAEICSAMAREVREALKEHVGDERPKDTQLMDERRPQRRSDRGGQGGNTPVCYRCGQPGHIMVGCRNEPVEGSRKQTAAGNGRQPLPWGNQRLG